MNQVLDVRPIRKPDRHPTVFAAYAALAVDESLVVVADHEPRHLRDEFAREHPGGHDWAAEPGDPGEFRVRVTKRASTALPRVLCDTTALPDDPPSGAAWRLEPAERDLDANVVRVAPDGRIDAHQGPELDVLMHVLSGQGVLTGERGDVELAAGRLVWLPRRSRRQITAGPSGLVYLTVHCRRKSLVLQTTR